MFDHSSVLVIRDDICDRVGIFIYLKPVIFVVLKQNVVWFIVMLLK